MTALHWLASDVHAGSVLIVAAFVAFIALFLAFARDEQRKDAAARIDLAPLHRTEDEHEAWERTFHPEQRSER